MLSLQPCGVSLAVTQEPFEASMTGFGVGDRDTDKICERDEAPMPANSDQQGGKSGKIHFIESTLFILALMAGFAQKCSVSGP